MTVLISDMQSLPEFIRDAQEDMKICIEGPWMIPEYVPEVTGEETGQITVVDVGGTMLRVSEISLPDAAVKTILQLQIPEVAKKDVISWLAGILRPLHLKEVAICWSFPLINGCIQPLGKGFSGKYTGKNLLEVLKAAGINAVSATHDGTAALLAEHYMNKKCKVSLTLGTGVNISVFESSKCIVNTEISMLGRPDLCPNLTLPFDPLFDLDPHFQPLEAMVGGPQLGAMVSKLSRSRVSTDELWYLSKSDPKYNIAHSILDRAAFLVAGSLHAVVGKFGYTGDCDIAFTGGVIAQTIFRELLESYLRLGSHATGVSFRLRPQLNGSEVGAAVARLAMLRHNS